MQLELFEEDQVVDLEVNGKTVYLKLKKSSRGVSIKVVDRNGNERNRNCLVTIRAGGVYLQPFIGDFGFPLTDNQTLLLL